MPENRPGPGEASVADDRQPGSLRVLALAPSAVLPDDGPGVGRLDVEREWQELAEAVKNQPVRLEVLWPAALAHMERVLAEAFAHWRRVPFGVVYVNCHGLPGRLLLDNGHGGAALVAGEAIGRVASQNGVDLVILGACDSGTGQPRSEAGAGGDAATRAEADTHSQNARNSISRRRHARGGRGGVRSPGPG